jgi:hypothetical protein
MSREASSFSRDVQEKGVIEHTSSFSSISCVIAYAWELSFWFRSMIRPEMRANFLLKITSLLMRGFSNVSSGPNDGSAQPAGRPSSRHYRCREIISKEDQKLARE